MEVGLSASRIWIRQALGYLEAASRCSTEADDELLKYIISVALLHAKNKLSPDPALQFSSGETSPTAESAKRAPLWTRVKDLRRKNDIRVDAIATQLMVPPALYLFAEEHGLDLGEVELIAALAIACASEKGVKETAHDPWIWSDRQLAEGVRAALELVNATNGVDRPIEDFDVYNELDSIRSRFDDVRKTGIGQIAISSSLQFGSRPS
jgi:hypothetical protein